MIFLGRISTINVLYSPTTSDTASLFIWYFLWRLVLGCFQQSFLLRGRRAEHGEHWRIWIDYFVTTSFLLLCTLEDRRRGPVSDAEKSLADSQTGNTIYTTKLGLRRKTASICPCQHCAGSPLRGGRAPATQSRAATWTPQSRRHHLHERFLFSYVFNTFTRQLFTNMFWACPPRGCLSHTAGLRSAPRGGKWVGTQRQGMGVISERVAGNTAMAQLTLHPSQEGDSNWVGVTEKGSLLFFMVASRSTRPTLFTIAHKQSPPPCDARKRGLDLTDLGTYCGFRFFFSSIHYFFSFLDILFTATRHIWN